MVYQWTPKRSHLLRWWQMTLKLLGKRDASDYGSTVLELIRMSIMCLRISEQGKAAMSEPHHHIPDIYLDVYFSYTQMGFIGSSWQSFPRISKLEASIKTSHQDAFPKSWELQPSYKDWKGIKLLSCERSRKWYCTRKQEAHTRLVTFTSFLTPLHSLTKRNPWKSWRKNWYLLHLAFLLALRSPTYYFWPRLEFLLLTCEGNFVVPLEYVVMKWCAFSRNLKEYISVGLFPASNIMFLIFVDWSINIRWFA